MHLTILCTWGGFLDSSYKMDLPYISWSYLGNVLSHQTEKRTGITVAAHFVHPTILWKWGAGVSFKLTPAFLDTSSTSRSVQVKVHSSLWCNFTLVEGWKYIWFITQFPVIWSFDWGDSCQDLWFVIHNLVSDGQQGGPVAQMFWYSDPGKPMTSVGFLNFRIADLETDKSI